MGGFGDLAGGDRHTARGTGGGAHTNLHARVKSSVHFGFDVDNLPDAEKQEEERVCEVTGGQQPPSSSLRGATAFRLTAHCGKASWDCGTCQMASRTQGQPPLRRESSEMSPLSSSVQVGPRSRMLPGHPRGAEVPEACLAPLPMQACTFLPEQTAPPALHPLSCTTGPATGFPHKQWIPWDAGRWQEAGSSQRHFAPSLK